MPCESKRKVPRVQNVQQISRTRAKKRLAFCRWCRSKVQLGDVSDLSNDKFDGACNDSKNSFNRGVQLKNNADKDQAKNNSIKACPFGYKGYYSPIGTRRDKNIHVEIPPDSDLPVHYWFYVFMHSSDAERALKPLSQVAQDQSSIDKRVLCLMKRNQVRILLKHMELYKSLPRHVVVIKAPNWERILSALAELETTLPEIMRFASYPIPLDTISHRYACTASTSHNFPRH